MDHLHKPWRVIEKMKKLRGKYGENASPMSRAVEKSQATKVTHSFPHLINKRYKVPKHPVFKEEFRPMISYRINDADRKRVKENMAKAKKMSLDNDLSEI